MILIKPTKLRYFCSKINSRCIEWLAYPLQGINDIFFKDNDDNYSRAREFLIRNKENTFILFSNAKKVFSIMEKDNVSYITFLIELTDPKDIEIIIKKKNDLESVLLGECDYVFTNKEKYYLKFRVSVNSSHERANMILIEKIYLLSYIDLLNQFETLS